MNNLEWITKWFASHCDGDWEHENMVTITTCSNPGWSVTIDLTDTFIEDVEIESGLVEKSEEDWYFYRFKDKQFSAAGDIHKLNFLIERFRIIAEENISL
jgi:hypothetical protein